MSTQLQPGNVARINADRRPLIYLWVSVDETNIDDLGEIEDGDPVLLLSHHHVMALWKVLTRDGRVGYMIASHLKALRP